MKLYVVHYYNQDIEESEVAGGYATFEAARAAILDIEQIASFNRTWELLDDGPKTTFVAVEGHKYHITEVEV